VATLLLYHAHPAQSHSRANAEMTRKARTVDGITRVDLYAEYPRFDIDPDIEQARLLAHEVIVFQFPLFWYSTPSIIKEWQDLVLEHGFAYGDGGTALAGKVMMLALTAAGPERAYSLAGYQRHTLRNFLIPLEQTAALCKMRFAAPYVLYGALRVAPEIGLTPHAEGFRSLLEAIRDDRYDFDAATARGVITHDTLPLLGEA